MRKWFLLSLVLLIGLCDLADSASFLGIKKKTERVAFAVMTYDTLGRPISKPDSILLQSYSDNYDRNSTAQLVIFSKVWPFSDQGSFFDTTKHVFNGTDVDTTLWVTSTCDSLDGIATGNPVVSLKVTTWFKNTPTYTLVTFQETADSLDAMLARILKALPDVAAGSSNGLFIAGSNAATTANITGNLSGSVGSVTGAVGSVTGAVGSVTGNVGGSVASVTGAVGSVTGNVGGSTASVTGAVGSVTGNVGGSVASVVGNVGGSVASVTGAVGSVTGNVGGSVASVTGAVGSVTGNVGGSVASVTGAVGSVTGNVGGSVASVVGNVGGNVTGSVASVTGAVGSVTGNVGGSVASVVGNVGGSVASVVGNVGGSVASVTGAVGSVTGAVGSVTGNVGGSVASVVSKTGFTASPTAGSIVAASFGANAIDAAAIKADASTKIGDAAATAILLTPGNKIANGSSGVVTVGTNNDKSGYTLAGGGLALDSAQTAQLAAVYGSTVLGTGLLSMLATYSGACDSCTQTLYPSDGNPYKDSVIVRSKAGVRTGKIVFTHSNDSTVVDQITFMKF
jgi:hypothetical protein